MANLELDEVLHQPQRTRIMTYLLTFGKTDFTSLKKALELSDGQMTTHMRVLLGKDYVLQHKSFVNNRPLTEYEVSLPGRKYFATYLENLRLILQQTGN